MQVLIFFVQIYKFVVSLILHCKYVMLIVTNIYKYNVLSFSNFFIGLRVVYCTISDSFCFVYFQKKHCLNLYAW